MIDRRSAEQMRVKLYLIFKRGVDTFTQMTMPGGNDPLFTQVRDLFR